MTRRHPGWFAMVAAAAACGALAACASRPSQTGAAELGPVIAFADPAMCRFTDDTAKLIAGFVRNDPDTLSDNWIRSGAVPAHLRDRLGPIERIKHDGWWVIRTEARGTLWGLPLLAIEQDFPEGGDPGGFTFEFAAPVAEVERITRARGFVARAGEEVAMGEPDALMYAVGLHPTADGRGAYFGCGYLS